MPFPSLHQLPENIHPLETIHLTNAMQDDYVNQQNMHNTVLNLLENDKFHTVWKKRSPTPRRLLR